MLDAAIDAVRAADVLAIIGTSLTVYPAASLIDFARDDARIYLIDPAPPEIVDPRVTVICAGASEGVARLSALL